jgi:hypothetical protein
VKVNILKLFVAVANLGLTNPPSLMVTISPATAPEVKVFLKISLFSPLIVWWAQVHEEVEIPVFKHSQS